MTEQREINDKPVKHKKTLYGVVIAAAFAFFIASFSVVSLTAANWSDSESASSSFSAGIYQVEARTPGSNIGSFNVLDGRSVELRRLTSGYWAEGDTRAETLGIRHSNSNDYGSLIPAKEEYMEINASGDSALINSLSWELYTMFSDSRSPSTCTRSGGADFVRSDSNSVLVASGDSLNEINYHYDIVIADMNNAGELRSSNARSDLCFIVSNDNTPMPEGRSVDVEWQFYSTTDASQGIN